MTKYIFIILLSCSALVNAQTAQEKTNARLDRLGGKFRYLLNMINMHYADSADLDKISEAAFDHLFKQLDRYSDYMTKEELKKFTQSVMGSGVGVGINISSGLNVNRVVYVYADSPADSAGIMAGDSLISIGDTICKGKSRDQLVKLLTGESGTKVRIKIQSLKTHQVRELELKRTTVIYPSVDYAVMITGTNTGYLRLTKFTANTYNEFMAAMQNLSKYKPKSLIIDVRDNAGGFVEQSCKIADEFIDSTYILINSVARDSAARFSYYSRKGGKFADLSLIVLINNRTASSAEILAGIFQDLDRAKLVGQQSYGKGSVQQFWQLTDSSGIKLTTSKYILPSGRHLSRPAAVDAELDESARLSANSADLKSIKSQINQFGGRTSLPVFKTLNGRVVFGESGIMPDQSYTHDSLTALTQVCASKELFFEYAVNLIDSGYFQKSANCVSLDDNQIKNFFADESVISKFRKFLAARNIGNDSMLSRDGQYMRREILSFAVRCLCGNRAEQSHRALNDDYVKSALKGGK